MSEKALTTLEIIKILSQLWDYNPAIIYAIGMQESGLDGFREYSITQNNLKVGTIIFPKILFENHKFRIHTNGKFTKSHPDLNKPRQYGTYDEQYEKYSIAKNLDMSAAINSCSWGVFQVLGENWEMLGFSGVLEFQKFQSTLVGQMCTAMRFIQKKRIKDIDLSALCKKTILNADDFAQIATAYNGTGYRVNKYDTKIAKFCKTYSILKHENIIDYSKKVQYICNQVLPKNEQLIVDGIIGEKTNRAINYLKGKKL